MDEPQSGLRQAGAPQFFVRHWDGTGDVMEKRSKKQHYLPQFILRRFCADNRRNLWVFDKQRLISYQSALKDAASENYFNDVRLDEVEISFEHYLEKIENTAAPILNKLIVSEDLIQLTAEDQATIIAFMVTQMVRGKSWRTGSDQVWEAVCKKLGGVDNAVRAGVPKPNRERDKLSILSGLTKTI
ncbi:MAG: DUF4238 domain-containing protein [Acidobacteriaceae bacterium]